MKHPNWLSTLKEEMLSQVYLADSTMPIGHCCSGGLNQTPRACTVENLTDLNAGFIQDIPQNSIKNCDAVEVASC